MRNTRYLVWKVLTEVERSTVTGLEDLLPVSPGHTVSPGLPGLTPGDLLAQPHQLLRHPDVLDSRQGVVALPLQHDGHGIYQEW